MEASTSIESALRDQFRRLEGISEVRHQKLLGPRKSRCIDFLPQTLGRPNVCFGRFRAPRSIEASTSIESALKHRFRRLVGIPDERHRKFVRGPKIGMRRFPLAYSEQTQCKFRSFLSTSSDRGIDIDRIGVETSI